MADFTLSSQSVWAVGATVKAYPRSAFAVGLSGPPSGSETDSAVVASDSTVPFTGLADDTAYVAYAQVASVDRYIGFSTPPAVADSGGVAPGTPLPADGALDALINTSIPDDWDDLLKFQLPTDAASYIVSVSALAETGDFANVFLYAFENEDHFNQFWNGVGPYPTSRVQVDQITVSATRTFDIGAILELQVAGGWWIACVTGGNGAASSFSITPIA